MVPVSILGIRGRGISRSHRLSDLYGLEIHQKRERDEHLRWRPSCPSYGANGQNRGGERIFFPPLSMALFLGNCETVSDPYESVQNKQMAAQNRFEFASYLFILPASGNRCGSFTIVYGSFIIS